MSHRNQLNPGQEMLDDNIECTMERHFPVAYEIRREEYPPSISRHRRRRLTTKCCVP